ncbi:MAG: hypothetical protein KKA70_07670, partial [Proteobacteria bacterium]|nr:hypothetical protein [Pseudomonadota bacterium]
MKKFLVLFWIILLSLTCSTVYAQVEGGSPAGFSEQQMQGITNYQVPVDQIREYQLQQMQLRRQGRAGFSSQAPYGGAGFVPGGRTPLGDVGAGSVYGPGIRPGFDPGMVSGIGPGARSGYGQGLGRANAYAPGYGSGYGPGRNTGSFGPRFAQRSAMPPQGNFGMYPGFAPNNFGPES